MSDKSSGVDFDRQVFVQTNAATARPPRFSFTGFTRPILALVLIAAIVVAGYKLLSRSPQDASSAADPELVNIDKRLTAMEARLERLETTRRVVVPAKQEQPPEPISPKPAARTVYQISPAPAASPDLNPAIAQRLSPLQQHLGALQDDESANHEAWQATTDKLADIAGQVGNQGVQILRSQDEVNQLLSRTEMRAIPFELLRGSSPQPVGPVSIVLKSSNAKTQRYTLCVYVQPSCIELKDRTVDEVVQFVLSRDARPLEVIATKITKDTVLGYLEVPRS